MIKIILLLLGISSIAHAEVTATDVISAANVVSAKMKVPIVTVVLRNENNPLGAAWRPLTQSCHIYISGPNAKALDLLIGRQPMIPMLEGFIAHEIAHCVEMKHVTKTMGVASMALYNTDAGVRIRAETMADIVAIMYWRQEYPVDGDNYVQAMIEWRKKAHENDIMHATHITLERALPLIHPRVDVFRAMEIRASIEDR